MNNAKKIPYDTSADSAFRKSADTRQSSYGSVNTHRHNTGRSKKKGSPLSGRTGCGRNTKPSVPDDHRPPSAVKSAVTRTKRTQSLPHCLPIGRYPDAQSAYPAKSSSLSVCESWPQPYSSQSKADRANAAMSIERMAMLEKMTGKDPAAFERLEPFEQTGDLHHAAHADYIDYCYADSTLSLHFAESTLKKHALSMENWLAKRCETFKSTLARRRQIAASLLGTRKFLPVIVRLRPLEMWIPDGAIDCTDMRYLNFSQILSIERCPRIALQSNAAASHDASSKDFSAQKNRCVIRFRDGLSIESSNFTQIERIFLQAKRLGSLLYSSQSSQ